MTPTPKISARARDYTRRIELELGDRRLGWDMIDPDILLEVQEAVGLLVQSALDAERAEAVGAPSARLEEIAERCAERVSGELGLSEVDTRAAEDYILAALQAAAPEPEPDARAVAGRVAKEYANGWRADAAAEIQRYSDARYRAGRAAGLEEARDD